MTLSDRLKVYGFGLLMGMIIMLSIPKLRHNFFEYVAWGDSNEWIIRDLKYLGPSDLEIEIKKLLEEGVLDVGLSNTVDDKISQENIEDQDYVELTIKSDVIRDGFQNQSKTYHSDTSVSFVMEYLDSIGTFIVSYTLLYDNQIIVDDYNRFKKLSKKRIYSNEIIDKLDDYDLDRYDLFKVLDDGWEDRDKRENLEDGFTLFVVDNYLNGDELSVWFKYNENEKFIIIDNFYVNQGLSTKSYMSYVWILLIFLIIMVPAYLLVRRMMRRRNI